MSFSIVILTYNEEANLEACLDSVSWCDDVWVLDSGSGDATVKVAQGKGVKVADHPFRDFGDQRNHANEKLGLKYPWVFHLDADERFTLELRSACEQAIAESKHSGYYIPNRMIFLNRWIRRSSLYPYPQVRLVNRTEFRFEAAGHGQREAWAERGLGHIDEPYDHHNFSKGIADWVARHNRYSCAEAEALLCDGAGHGASGSASTPTQVRRLRAIKRGLGGSPLRALGKFGYLYLWKRGFLDGVPGLIYCGLQGFYEFLISAKVAELKLLRQLPDSQSESADSDSGAG